MPMLRKPWEKYEQFCGPSLLDRSWPSQKIRKAPRWLATDLRDGNQSLASPMTIKQKWKFANMLVDLGYKEIEIGTPSANAIEYDFARQVVSTPEAVPDDVWLQALCPCRLELIDQNVKSLTGAKKAIVSLYHASSATFLDTVYGMSQQEVHDKVVEAIRHFKTLTKDDPIQSRTTWNLMFSPEAFSDTDLGYSLRLCEAAKSIWEPSNEVPIIFTFPATVEMSTPNVYADQVEIFSRSISDRGKVSVSLHPHNDRGCAVAAAELGQMAGADRVEGCLFGNGERAGNVDLVTLGLNLYSQGIDPGIDFSNLASIRAVFEECTNIKVHCRAPYAGDLVFTAYSGAHQDAINKGMTKMGNNYEGRQQQLWKVPYLAMDPLDIGSNYEAIIRLNSQSGKGGVAWTLSSQLDIHLPKGLQMELSKIIKSASETAGGTIAPAEIANLFLDRYHISEPDPRILSANLGHLNQPDLSDEILPVPNSHGSNRPVASVTESNNGQDEVSRTVDLFVTLNGREERLKGRGGTVTSAISNAFAATSFGNLVFQTHHCDLARETEPPETMVAVECHLHAGRQSTWGVRASGDKETSELLASLSAGLDFLERSSGNGDHKP